MNTPENTPSHAHATNQSHHSHAGETHAAHAHDSTPHTHTAPPAKNTPARAWMIGGFIVLVLLLVGFLIFTKFQPTEGNTPGVKPVEIKLLVDGTCTICPQTNTILAKLDESNIKYELKTIDFKSTEGQQLVSEYGVEYVPTALVNVIGLDQNSTIQAALQGQFIKDPLTIKKGWIIVPEKFLDTQPKVLTFIKKPETCSVPENTIRVDAQLDFGDCKPCIDAHLELERLKDKYASLTVDYDPIMYGRTNLKAISAAFLSNKGAVCAESMGFLDDYVSCSYFNAQFYGNIDINFMKSCMLDAGASLNTVNTEFVPCVTDLNNVSPAEQTLVSNTKIMHAWNPLKYTPSFVLDCTYAFVGHKSLEKNICTLHPETEGCSEYLTALEKALAEAQMDTNTTSDANASVDLNIAQSV